MRWYRPRRRRQRPPSVVAPDLRSLTTRQTRFSPAHAPANKPTPASTAGGASLTTRTNRPRLTILQTWSGRSDRLRAILEVLDRPPYNRSLVCLVHCSGPGPGYVLLICSGFRSVLPLGTRDQGLVCLLRVPVRSAARDQVKVWSVYSESRSVLLLGTRSRSGLRCSAGCGF